MTLRPFHTRKRKHRMNARRLAALILTAIVSSAGAVSSRADAQPASTAVTSTSQEVTPPRVSYVNGNVSFWRPGAQDWAPAKLNTALAPGDVLYADRNANAEIQIGPRAFVRLTEAAQIGLDNHDADFLQFRVTGGQAALDVRELASGQTIELATPVAAFTIEQAGYYRIDVAGESVSFSTHDGGRAIVTPAHGSATPIALDQRVVITGAESPRVELGPAPALTAWDTWNAERSAYLLQQPVARYVSPEIYGAQELDRHGTWRVDGDYGPLWAPRTVPAGWVPYSAGRWIWDPVYGWTWLDDAPWGWAPYHYGRWVFVHNTWAWAPGPVRVRPVYAPALVVFFGEGRARIGRPVAWAPLGWGEPLIPWWGRRGFVGVPSWGGWGGPRVVNNVVVKNTTIVHADTINVYRNAHVVNGVVGVRPERFGRDRVAPTRLAERDVRQLTPVRGPLEVKPVATSVMPAVAPAAKPPAGARERRIVSTRPPQDITPALRAQGLTEGPDANRATPPRLVPSPRATAPSRESAVPSAARPEPAAEPPRRERSDRVDSPARSEAPTTSERPRDPGNAAPTAVPPRPPQPGQARETTPTPGLRRAMPPTPAARSEAPPAPRIEPPIRSETPARGERPAAAERSERRERDRDEPSTQSDRPGRMAPSPRVMPPQPGPAREVAPPTPRSEARPPRLETAVPPRVEPPRAVEPRRPVEPPARLERPGRAEGDASPGPPRPTPPAPRVAPPSTPPREVSPARIERPARAERAPERREQTAPPKRGEGDGPQERQRGK